MMVVCNKKEEEYLYT